MERKAVKALAISYKQSSKGEKSLVRNQKGPYPILVTSICTLGRCAYLRSAQSSRAYIVIRSSGGMRSRSPLQKQRRNNKIST